jgi:peptidyl-prolyl cis-trans isomerase A (cyclophilin A)
MLSEKTFKMKNLLMLAFVAVFFSGTQNHNPRVVISTELGQIEAEIFLDKAPVTAGNFLKYIDAGKYNTNACFYRVVRLDNQADKKVKIEVIQGGYGDDSLIEKYQFTPIRHETTKETGILHKDGVLSMARNEPGTASSEFFICIGDQPELDFNGKRNPDKQGFAAFGKVVNGMDLVKKIQSLSEKDQYLVNPVKILQIKRIN